MMFILFPELRKLANHYQFDDKYQVANWLYNLGETPEDKAEGKAYTYFYHR